jgi:hypothetical protein
MAASLHPRHRIRFRTSQYRWRFDDVDDRSSLVLFDPNYAAHGTSGKLRCRGPCLRQELHCRHCRGFGRSCETLSRLRKMLRGALRTHRAASHRAHDGGDHVRGGARYPRIRRISKCKCSANNHSGLAFQLSAISCFPPCLLTMEIFSALRPSAGTARIQWGPEGLQIGVPRASRRLIRFHFRDFHSGFDLAGRQKTPCCAWRILRGALVIGIEAVAIRCQCVGRVKLAREAGPRPEDISLAVTCGMASAAAFQMRVE